MAIITTIFAMRFQYVAVIVFANSSSDTANPFHISFVIILLTNS